MEPIDLGFGCYKDETLYPSTTGKGVYIPRIWLEALAISLEFDCREAGHRLNLSETAVRHRLSRLYARLGVFDRWEAAVHLGWVKIPDGLLEPSDRPEPSYVGGSNSRFTVALAPGQFHMDNADRP